MQKCENGQNQKKMKTIKTKKCENGQNAKIRKRKNAKTVKTQKIENGKNSKILNLSKQKGKPYHRRPQIRGKIQYPS